jgi:hypothetical protein
MELLESPMMKLKKNRYRSFIQALILIVIDFLFNFQILNPREMVWKEAPEVLKAACGTQHTLFLTQSGKVFSCGNNDYGQLGQDVSRKRPRMFKFRMCANPFHHKFKNYSFQLEIVVFMPL